MTKPTQQAKQIDLGQTAEGKPVVFDLFKFLETRLLIQASSGGGKSFLVRRIIEQVLHQSIPVWVVDPEGEFTTLREKFDMVIFADDDGDLNLNVETMKAALPELLKKGVSCVFDLSDLNLEAKRERVVLICQAILSLPKPDWKSMLLCLDEAQIFAPEGKASASMEAVTDLASRIRKRGGGLVVATQRLSALDKNLTSHLHNRVIGYCLEDIEIKRAEGYIGKAPAKLLRAFMPGDFFALGAALNFREPVQFHAGAVETTHPDPSTRRSIVAPKATTQLEHILKELRESIEVQKEKDNKPSKKSADEDLPQASIPDEIIKREEALETREKNLLEREQKLETLDREIYLKVENLFAEANKLIEDRFNDLKSELSNVFKLPQDVQSKLEMYKPFTENPVNIELPAEKGVQAATEEDKAQEGAIPREILRIPNQSVRTKRNADFLHRRQIKILNTLLTFEQLGVREVERSNVAVFSGVSPTSGQFSGDLSFLRNVTNTAHEYGHLVEYVGGSIKLTNEGRSYATPTLHINTLADLQEAWCNHLPKKQAEMIRYLLKSKPGKRISKTHLAQDTNQSETSGAYNGHLSALRKFGLIEYDEHNGLKCVYLTNMLFPKL